MRSVVFLSAVVLSSSGAFGFDCTGVKLPSSVVICSDPDLVRLADERQQAFNEARWGKAGTDLLDPQQDKELWENQRAWVREYATTCGAPPDRTAPRVPVAPTVIACFKQAAEARIAFLRAYGQRARESASRQAATPQSERMGPGFDCAKAVYPLAQMICADADLSRTDLRFNQAYWALFQQLDAGGRQHLKQEDIEVLDRLQEACAVPRSGGLTAAVWRARDCVRDAYERQRLIWLARLGGPAHEEATRSLELHVALERRLRQLAFLTTPPVPEGVYGSTTRRAVMAWQQSKGRPVTGILGESDAIALRGDGEPTRKEPSTPSAIVPEPPVVSLPPAAGRRTAPAPGNARVDTGYDLYQACGSEQTNSAEFLRCMTFLHGVWDGAMTMQMVGKDRVLCPKRGVQVGQMVLIFQDWARKHPKDLSHDAAAAAVASFVDTYPCEAPRQPAAGPALIPSPESAPPDVLLK